jgi:oligopeptide/dipeptide ABC transporter ATP-binding protein
MSTLTLPTNTEPLVAGKDEPLLTVKNLHVTFRTRRGELHAVDGVNFEVPRSSMLGIAGESGSGKSVAVRAVIGLHPPLNTKVTGSVRFEGQELLGLSQKEWRQRRGRDISMVYQDTMRCLNPTMTIGAQISEAIRLHKDVDKAEAKKQVVELLNQVRIPSASTRYSNYPHQLSGGMRQRVMIAMALSCDPKLLIADEPTTALDVTTQAQIMNLIADLQRDRGMSVIFITHDLHLAAAYTESIAVMYSGRIVERARSEELLERPRMPYTRALVAAIPGFDMPSHHRLVAIEGRPPDPFAFPDGCRFNPRCDRADDHCRIEAPALIEGEPGRFYACWHPVADGDAS